MSSAHWNSQASQLPEPLPSSPSNAQYCAELSARIRAVCQTRSISEVARLTHFNRETVRRYLRGQRPDVEFVARLAVAFHISTEWLFLGEGESDATQTHPDRHTLRLADAHG